MTPAVRGQLNRQWGLVTRPQVLAAGVDPAAIARLVRNGSWVQVRRGVYAESETWQAAQRWDERQLLHDRAASLRISRAHVMSHDSAALELGMAVLAQDRPTTHVTRPGVVGSHLVHGVKHHLAPFNEHQAVTVAGRVVLDPARTAADIAREHGLVAGTVAFDSAFRAGADRPAMTAALAAMAYWPGVTVARAAYDASDPGSDSLGETLARGLVEELGFGRPQTQFGLTDGVRTAWCDLRLGRHVFEFDGRSKYLRTEDGGLAEIAEADVVWHEKQRQDWVCGFKLGMSRIVWADLWGERRRAARHRLEREYLDTVARFGTSVDDLAAYRPRASRRRAR
jgi:Transcriptional regulator, AbiEi antitoxin